MLFVDVKKYFLRANIGNCLRVRYNVDNKKFEIERGTIMGSSGLKEDIFYSSSWMQEILEISNIGLWLLEINKNNTDVRLYADVKC